MNFLIKKYRDFKKDAKQKLVSNKLFDQKLLISKWLDSKNIKNYTITDNLIINVEGDVDISSVISRATSAMGRPTIDKELQIDEIPFQFGNVSGNFNCSYNKLVSFKGCPEYIGGKFDASYNQIDTFEFFPKFVGSEISLHYNNLNSLKFFPHDFLSETNSAIYFSYNKIFDLRYMPYKFFSRIFFYKNPIDKIIELISPHSLQSTYENNKRKLLYKYMVEYEPIIGNKIYLDKFKDVIYMIDMKDFDFNQIYQLEDYKIID